MTAQSTSTTALIATLLLSDHRVLRERWATPFASPLEWLQMREAVFLAFQPWSARMPDHVFASAWQGLQARPGGQPMVLAALGALTDEFLQARHGRSRTRRERLDGWQQGVLSRCSSLPIHAMADVHFGIGRGVEDGASRLPPIPCAGDGTRWRARILPLLLPDEPAVADYIQREGLHETHLHLNGSTFAELCWLRTLRAPKEEVSAFVRSWTYGKHSKKVRELVKQADPDLTPHLLYRRLRAAARLRAWLIAIAEGRVAPGAQYPHSCDALCDQDDGTWSRALRMSPVSWRDEPTIDDELRWICKLMLRRRRAPGPRIAGMLHAYLLLMNGYYQLLVQNEQQYGFDQFQKLTLTDLREPAERDYRARFHAMHGLQTVHSTIGYLEGRFAPKDTLSEAYQLFQRILGGYLDYLCDVDPAATRSTLRPQPLSRLLAELDQQIASPAMRGRAIHRLALVAHFIKRPWSHEPRHRAGPYRHHGLDMSLRKTAGVLLAALARWPRLQTWVRGIDAAANELDAPPEVFAPIFRVCLRAGLSRRTYHVGEDFRHLLCGIGNIRDALHLLDLRDGDRIGHGTAMGIAPKLWLERMPRSLYLPRGEWMLALLSAWQMLRGMAETQHEAAVVLHELETVALTIFRRVVTARELEAAMALRGLDRRAILRQLESLPGGPPSSFNDAWREEAERVCTAWENSRESLQLLWAWLSDPDVLARTESLIETPTAFLTAQVYLRLQQALMREVAERGVLVETLPSSNVRISQYQHVGEHHALRWMRVPGHVQEGDPDVMVCLGSDDPGIFAADLESEFHMLYAALRKCGLDDSDALLRLGRLNERGRTYRFHHPMVG